MKRFLILLAAGLILSGCISKSKSNLRMQQAYLAGQRDAEAQSKSRTIAVMGDVKNHTVEWVEDITLTKALVAAEYKGIRNPREIWVRRAGQRYPVNLKALLSGREDPPLEPGDFVEIQ